jgi:hypothetical protein
LDERLRDLTRDESLCVCWHVRSQHNGHCGGEAQPVLSCHELATGQDLITCNCSEFRLHTFDVRPFEGTKLDQVAFNERDITQLLADAAVRDRDDDFGLDFRTWQLRLSLRSDAREQAADIVQQLERLAAHVPPYVVVKPERMSAGQWVLRLV